MLQSRSMRHLKNKYVIAGLIVLVIIGVYIFTRGRSATNIESATVTIAKVVEKVSVTGKVSSVDKADLAFEKSGTIARVATALGNQVKRGDLIAALNSAEDAAALAGARAQLAESTRALRPEEYAADQAAVAAASTTLASAQEDALNAVQDNYNQTQSAITDYSDTFFDNPQSYSPTINVNTADYDRINSERLTVAKTLKQWQDEIKVASTTANPDTLLADTKTYLETIKNFMSDLAEVINDLTPAGSGLTRSTIDGKISTMNTALTNLNQVISAITTAQNNLNDAQAKYHQAENQFALERAGSSAETIAAGQAKVAQAAATLAKDNLLAPIDGTVTRVDPQVGEFVAAGQAVFAIQSNGAFKIEAFVPEADIAKVAMGNGAAVTLDAYGPDVPFPATVTMIDPAETVLEGVPTYKLTLLFNQADPRVRSGMTANLDILTREAPGVLTIPSRAVLNDGGVKTVRVLNANGKTWKTVAVTTGLKGSDGSMEIKSGLTAGQKVVTYIKP